MILKIVELTERNGGIQPDPNKLVAKIKLENQTITMNVYNKKYENELKELFAQPFYRMKESAPTYPGGPILDIPEKIEPWNPEVIKILPEELLPKGLGFFISDGARRD
ncbi:MAG: hypothetical protein M1169_08555 [Firmicutes bacterium]|nr:hypothetical protein [Bacillota bacterium]